ncbi:MAG: TatD family hydrolase [Lewinellaceae bacterium]|nr:TatD family hydrolase [Lewinellaceae bacterium]
MELVDTHTHLYTRQLAPDIEQVVQRAKDAGVQKFYLPNIDSSSIEAMLSLENTWPDSCFPMMGIHPCSVNADFEQELAVVKEWIGKRPFAAIGEIGIDLYWDKTFIEEQKTAFLQQIRWAKDLGLPVVIHCRESMDLVIDLVAREADDRLWGVFHCFTGDAKQAEKIREMGFFLGIGGVLTYKNSGLAETLQQIGLEKVVLETDSPYLAPVPYRGKRNESAYIRVVAEKAAEVLGVPPEKVAEITTDNAKTLFNTRE